MISGSTKLLALAGSPVSHSLSPRIHNAFARAAGVDCVYLAFDITPDSLPAFIDAARTLNISGFNLTMPHKERILPYLGGLDEAAGRFGAVNTVVNRDGCLYGYNTDGGGFIAALESAGFKAFDADVLVLGAGGAGKAVSVALADAGMTVLMAARRAVTPPEPGIAVCAWDAITDAASGAALLVNATPLGMRGSGDFSGFAFLDALPPRAVVCDLVYSPRETTLIREARKRGLSAINGLPMLVWQAALAFGLFTGLTPEPRAIADVLREINDRSGI